MSILLKEISSDVVVWKICACDDGLFYLRLRKAETEFSHETAASDYDDKLCCVSIFRTPC